MTDFDRIRQLLAGIEEENEGLRQDHDALVDDALALQTEVSRLQRELAVERRLRKFHQFLAAVTVMMLGTLMTFYGIP